MPKEIQEPSAFKRRNSTRFKKHLKIATSLSELTQYRIKTCFESNDPRVKRPGFVPLVNIATNKSFIIRGPVTDENKARLSAASLYVFATREQCELFIKKVTTYFEEKHLGPRVGLKFWPEFRILIKQALNYNEVNAIAPSRKGIQSAIKDLDIYHEKKMKREREAQRLNK